LQNQPHSQWQVIDSAASQRDEAWDLDRRTGLRTTFLWLGTFLLLSISGLRLYDLKANHAEDFLANAHPATIISETIPATDGRIYSSDGQLLAYDDQLFALAIHYRWLEAPPNEIWWKQQARKRLTKSNRKNRQALKQAKAEVLQQREKLWKRLALISGEPLEKLKAKRLAIQQRIERIANAVRKKQEAREKTAPEAEPLSDADKTRWKRIWSLVKSELTQPPRRSKNDPIIIREELDYHILIDQLSTADVAEIESHPTEFPGTRIITKTRRVYPGGSLAAHVIGVRRALRDDQIRKRNKELQTSDPLSYQTGDRQGESGVEKTYNITLRGLPGKLELIKNRRGEILKTNPVRASRSGNHLVLAINSQLQRTAEELLDRLIPQEESLVPPLPEGQRSSENSGPTAGAVLVMNIYSGELLTAATAPRPDLSLMATGDATHWKRLNSDQRFPLLSRITQVAIAPGSTFKPLTAIAFCESLGIPTEPIICKGYLDTPQSHRCSIFRTAGVGHGKIGLVDALAQSCNVYFFTAARKMGPEPLVKWCANFEFGKPTGIDLPFEKSGSVPSPADNQGKSKRHWYPGDNLGLAIGQSYLTVTPLQMVKLIAAVANGGELVTPHVVSRILPGDESSQASAESLLLPEKSVRKLSISPATLSIVREGLEQVVENPKGTAHKTVAMKQVAVAGKTGSAQTGIDNPSHAWFIGYVPAQQPRYAIVVLLEQGGSGGKNAGPLARKMIERLLDLGLIEPDPA